MESSPSTEESRSALSGSGELARSVLFNNALDTFKSITTNAITCKSTSRPPSPVVGQMIYQTDTNSIFFWTGTSWAAPAAPDATPIGTISAFGGVNLPAGYLWCDGTQKLIASYPQLHSALGPNRYGVDTAQFFLPNLTSHLPRGAATTGGAVTTNNNNTHGHGINATTVTVTNNDNTTSLAHNHNVNAGSTSSLGGHNHNNNGRNTTGGSNRNVATGNTAGVANSGHQHNVAGGSTSSTGDHTHNNNNVSTSSSGGTLAHSHANTATATTGTVIDNTTYVPAFVEVNYIIKT